MKTYEDEEFERIERENKERSHVAFKATPSREQLMAEVAVLTEMVRVLSDRVAELEKPWVGLTNDEVNNFAAGCHLGNSVQGAIYKAEAKLKEKNA
jgi:hypothetical protein